MSRLLFANPVQTQNEIIKQVRIENRLGKSLPLDLIFEDERSRTVTLGDYFHRKPVILLPVYYECPMLCGLVLKGYLRAAKVMKFTPGKEFELVTFSISPKETPELAVQKKESVLKEYGRPEAQGGWHFLTAHENPESVQKLTEALGYHYVYDPTRKEYAHPALLVIATPEGKIVRYFSGVEFSAKDIVLSILEASEGKVGNLFDQILMLCYHYDPTTGKYGLVISRVIQALGVLTVILLGAFIGLSLRDEHSKSKAHP